MTMKNTLSILLTSFIIGGSFPISVGHSKQENLDKNIVVFKTPWCGCCQVWVDALKKAGYRLETNDLNDLRSIKQQGNVPKSLEACHTAVIGNDNKYILEGHVPVEAIELLLKTRPDIRGIATPGMPMGSLGMGFDPAARYIVYAYTKENSKPTIFYEAGTQ